MSNTPPGGDAPYTLHRVEKTLGLTRATVLSLVAAGFVTPARGARNEMRFSFQDLVLMRTAQSLRVARLSTRSILRALQSLRGQLPRDMPLSGLRILAVGDAVAVREAGRTWEAETGQLLLAFEQEPATGRLKTRALALFDRAAALEATDAGAAEAAYRAAIRQDPCFEDAYLNLGAMLCEAGRCRDAIELYDDALRHCGHSAVIHFNRGIALEDGAEAGPALRAYEAALALDAGFADAHYNAAVLLEREGRLQAALRHFNAYRRLSSASR